MVHFVVGLAEPCFHFDVWLEFYNLVLCYSRALCVRFWQNVSAVSGLSSKV